MILVLFIREIIPLLCNARYKIQGEKDSALYSCFLSALIVAVFHLITSQIRDLTFSFELEKMQLRKLFYFSMLIMECAFIIVLFFVHKVKECQFSLVAHFCFMTSSIMCLIQLTQLYLRGFLGLELFVPYYKLSVVSINLLVLVIISIYPFYSVYKKFLLLKDRRKR